MKRYFSEPLEKLSLMRTKDRRPYVAVECKYSATAPSSSWKKFDSVLKSIPKLQFVRQSGVDFTTPMGIRVVSASKVLSQLN